MNISIQVDADILTRVLDRLGSGELMDAVVGDVAKTIHKTVVGRTPVGIVRTQTHSPGTAKKSWTAPISVGTGEVSFGNDLPYICALEYGSVPGNRPWPRSGPRTMVAGAGNIYSRQAPEGMAGYTLQHDLREIESVVEAIVAEYIRFFEA